MLNSNITSVSLPNTITSFGADELTDGDIVANGHIFAYCDKLEKVTLPSEITDIPMATFAGCGNLKTVEIPSTVTTIGQQAFWGSGIESIVIPSSVTQTYAQAFWYCPNLKTVVFLHTDSNSIELEVGEGNGLTDYHKDAMFWNGETGIDPIVYIRSNKMKTELANQKSVEAVTLLQNASDSENVTVSSEKEQAVADAIAAAGITQSEDTTYRLDRIPLNNVNGNVTVAYTFGNKFWSKTYDTTINTDGSVILGMLLYNIPKSQLDQLSQPMVSID